MATEDWQPEPRRPDITWPAPTQRQAIVAATGTYPYAVDDLRHATPADYKWLIHPPLADDPVDIIVVGAIGWDTLLLTDAIQRGHSGTMVLPQDGFLDLVHFGHDWWAERPANGKRSKLEIAVQQQDGIRVAKLLVQEWNKGLSFAWPTTDAGDSSTESVWSSRLNEISALRKHGYQIQDRTEAERWAALVRCVDDVALGLQRTAYFIAYLIRTRRPHVRAEVIDAWRADLAKLRTTYHIQALNFYWPEP